MNRTELIDAVSGDTGLTRQQSEAAIDAIVYEITAGVRSGNPVRITGFGTFKLRERQARRGRNPQTGAPVRIKASKGIGFTPGVKLKADLNSRAAVAKPKSIAGTGTATKRAAAAKAPAKATSRATKSRATTTRATTAKKAATKSTTRTTAKKTAAKTTATKRAAKR